MELLSIITQDIMDLEVMESHSEVLVVRDAPVYEIDVTEMNRVYDALLESTMELFHDTQERRRAYNRAIRESRHLNRLAAQRERAQQARAVAQNTVAPARVQPVDRIFTVTGLTKLKTKALKQSELDAQMPDCCGICMEVNTRANSIETECGHGFCKACFDQYIDSIRCKPRAERRLKLPDVPQIRPEMHGIPVKKSAHTKTESPGPSCHGRSR